MQDSSIEWTTKTWNPVTGCTKVSPGCEHCYAENFAERWRGVPGHAYEHGFDLQLRPWERRVVEAPPWSGAGSPRRSAAPGSMS
jgi:protein gp37